MLTAKVMIEYCQLLQCATSSVSGGMVFGEHLGLAALDAGARKEFGQGKGTTTTPCDSDLQTFRPSDRYSMR